MRKASGRKLSQILKANPEMVKRRNSEISRLRCLSSLERSLLVKGPEIAAQWRGVKDSERQYNHPGNTSVSSGLIVLWECAEGHTWWSRVADRTRKERQGCPTCALVRKRRPGKVARKESIAALTPGLVPEWRGMEEHPEATPENTAPNSAKPVRWECEDGHTWTTPPSHRRDADGNVRPCPICRRLGDAISLIKLNWNTLVHMDAEGKSRRLRELGVRRGAALKRTLAETWVSGEITDEQMNEFISKGKQSVVEKILQQHEFAKYSEDRPQIPRKIRRTVFARDRYCCKCCGDDQELEIDHIIPYSRGGSNDISNLQTLCRYCNGIKSAREMTIGELRDAIFIQEMAAIPTDDYNLPDVEEDQDFLAALEPAPVCSPDYYLPDVGEDEEFFTEEINMITDSYRLPAVDYDEQFLL